MLYLDHETFNEVDISVGTYRYAETAEVLLTAYAYKEEPWKIWDRTQEPFPPDLWDMLRDDDLPITAHNAMFDRTITRLSLDIDTRLERWRCTMVKAFSHGFPGGLDQLGKILGLPADQAKLKIGKKLIHRFCKPAPSNHKATRYDHTTHPEEWKQFKLYGGRDIDAMRAIDKRLPNWNWKEKDIALYHLDQHINDQGIGIDRELVGAGAHAAADDKVRMAKEFIELTGGLVEKPTQREKFKQYLNEKFSLSLDNTRSETFRAMLSQDGLHPECRRLMEISVLANKTSTAKYATLAPAVSNDGRFRGGLQFRGAARTRRWAGRTFQPHNLPSRGLPSARSIEQYIAALKRGDHEFLFDDLMLYGSAALRGVVIAPEGKKLVSSDLSNIEGRIAAYIAGETWKLKAFEAYDTFKLDDDGQKIPVPNKPGEYQRSGPDLYNVTAVSILGGDPYKVPKAVREAFGKIPDLAFGFGGGYGACQQFARAYNLALKDQWDTISANVDPKIIAAAKSNYASWGKARNPEADPDEWIASDVLKLAWRARHPNIAKLWKACEVAATSAIQSPGETFSAGRLDFSVRRHAGMRYLLCRLPSKNFLCYFDPRISETISVDDEGREQVRRSITYMGVDATATGGVFGKWTRIHTYGGKLVENACQTIAMDAMAENMPAIQRSGFPIVLTVHDEIVTETMPDKTVEELAALMSQDIEWLPGFPLAAAGFETQRWRKD